MPDLPLLKGFAPTDTIAWCGGEPIECRRFLQDVFSLAERLPDRSCVFNLCEDRYHFLVGFAAALVRGQTSLLPPNEVPRLLREIAAGRDNSYCLIDKDEYPPGLDVFRYPDSRDLVSSQASMPAFAPERVAAVTFTSGSTGLPKPNPKTWGSLVAGADRSKARFISTKGPHAILGTVPPQHMYGLETTLLLPIQSGNSLHHGKPFFPEDVRTALEQLPPPRILITTPAHINACVSAQTALPELEFIVSATAPLSISLATQAEELYGTEVLEIYGCTEAGSIASRRTIAGELWRTLDGMELFERGERCFVCASSLTEPVELADLIQLRDAREFSLHGRSVDLINIAGKRTSLGDLNHKLNEIEGVRDGVFFMPDEVAGAVTRLMAFVVAPSLSKEDVLTGLRARIDPVFFPRPLYLVDALPRTATGKLPRARVQELAALLRNKAKSA